MTRFFLICVVTGLSALGLIGLRAACQRAGWLGADSAQQGRPTVDAEMAASGAELFRHEWTPSDPLANGGDGLGPVYNATSCVACHLQNGTGGSGGLNENVTVYTVTPVTLNPRAADVRSGVVHARSTLPKEESLRDVHAELPAVVRPTLGLVLARTHSSGGLTRLPAGVELSQRNTPALFGAGWIDNIPEQAILANEEQQHARQSPETDSPEVPRGRAARLPGGKVGRFGWKGQSADLASFVRAACANELGLGNSGQAQPRPLFQPDYQSPGNDLTDQQCDQLTAYIASLPRPREEVPPSSRRVKFVAAGRAVFATVGCAECHTPDTGGVTGLFSDLLLHSMGAELAGGGSYNFRPETPPVVASGERLATTDEWRTPPLWGVADSAPYMHDGRAATLEEAIALHGGEATRAANGFAKLSSVEQVQLVAFLKTLRAPTEQ